MWHSHFRPRSRGETHPTHHPHINTHPTRFLDLSPDTSAARAQVCPLIAPTLYILWSIQRNTSGRRPLPPKGLDSVTSLEAATGTSESHLFHSLS